MGNIALTYYPQKGFLVALGAGESGVGAAILAKDRGFDVFVSDRGNIAEGYKSTLLAEGIAFEEGGHSEGRILTADLVVKSPGIPGNAPLVEALRAKGVPVISEIEFAAQYTDARLCCITGSNGKSTTTMLAHYMLQKGGMDAGLAGNIGHSFARQVAREPHEVYVLEISSFMLDDMHHFRADVAVLLNITPDHLDRYDYRMENYAASKFRIVRNQTAADHFIYCADDPETAKWLDRYPTPAQHLPFSLAQRPNPGAYMDEHNNIIINVMNGETFAMSTEELSLQGPHNVHNNMASGLLAKVQYLRNRTIQECMGTYTNMPHRLEHVASIGGVDYVNDSKATNVNAVWYALQSVQTNIVLIMGGVEKGSDYDMLSDMVREKVRAIVCIGRDTSRIHNAFEGDVEIIVNGLSMQDAVQMASNLAQKGDTVLLSPACASFDWFRNFEERGDKFKEAVMAL